MLRGGLTCQQTGIVPSKHARTHVVAKGNERRIVGRHQRCDRRDVELPSGLSVSKPEHPEPGSEAHLWGRQPPRVCIEGGAESRGRDKVSPEHVLRHALFTKAVPRQLVRRCETLEGKKGGQGSLEWA